MPASNSASRTINSSVRRDHREHDGEHECGQGDDSNTNEDAGSSVVNSEEAPHRVEEPIPAAAIAAAADVVDVVAPDPHARG